MIDFKRELAAADWHGRVLQELKLRNITERHVRVIQYARQLIDAGLDTFKHKEISLALAISIRCVGEALRRAAKLGLFEVEARYVPHLERFRRRVANLYRAVTPSGPAIARPQPPKGSARFAGPVESKGFREGQGLMAPLLVAARERMARIMSANGAYRTVSMRPLSRGS